MAIFTDTVTVYNKISDNEWKRTVVTGVQWTAKEERKNIDGILSIVQYVSVTFPEGTYKDIMLNSSSKEDCIVYGAVTDVVSGARGSRISDILDKYPQSGLIKSVNDNTNRSRLKNIKVVVA